MTSNHPLLFVFPPPPSPFFPFPFFLSKGWEWYWKSKIAGELSECWKETFFCKDR